MRPAREVAVRVERRGKLVDTERAVKVVLQIILTRPDYLYSLSDRLCHQHRLCDEVIGEAPSEAAARARQPYLDVRACDTRHCVDEPRGTTGTLERGDQQGAIAPDLHERPGGSMVACARKGSR